MAGLEPDTARLVPPRCGLYGALVTTVPSSETAAELPARHRLPPALVSMTGFLPWIVYWILVGNVSFTTSVVVALGVAVVVASATYARTRSMKVFEVGGIVIFLALLIVSLAGEESFLERWIQPLSNLGILVLALATVAVGRPFTLEYAREAAPPEVQGTAGFVYVNRVLTWVWIAAFAVMTAVSFIPPIVQGEATIRDGASTLSIVCYWVIPYVVLALAAIVTARFPDWFVASVDRVTAPVERLPRPVAAPGAPAGEASHGALRLALAPSAAPLDGALDVRLEGARPGSGVVMEAVSPDAFGTTWRSRVSFTADADGRVAVDGSPLVWSMEPPPDETQIGIFVPSEEPFALTVRAETDGEIVDCYAIRGTAPGVRRVGFAEGEVVAELHVPAEDGPHRGVLVLPGSEGGLDSQASLATLLATRGYVAMVLGYVGVPGLEDHIVALPLERIAEGVRALESRPEVHPGRVGAVAISKGSEGLLAAAAAFPDLPLCALVLLSPASVVWQALGDDGAVPGVGSWTLAGAPLPFLAIHEEAIMPQFLRHAVFARAERRRHEPALLHLAAGYAPGLEDAEERDRATIAAERVTLPLLLAAGDDDELWPSARMARDILARREGMASPQPDQLVVLPGAGHLLRPPLLPTVGAWHDGIAFGGRPDAMADGHARLWADVVAFLDRHIGDPRA